MSMEDMRPPSDGAQVAPEQAYDIGQPRDYASGQGGKPALQSNIRNSLTFAGSHSLKCEETYPEGGVRAWLVVVGAWCALAPSMGLLNTHAVLQAWIAEHDLNNASESKIGWIFSCYAFFLYFGGAQVGPIFDAYDIRVLLIPGSIGFILSMFFLSLSTDFYQYLLSYGVLGGVSASLLFNPSLAAIGHWFQKRRAFATGLACTAGGLAGIAFPLIILFVSPRLGFAWAIRIIAFACLVCLVVACISLRKRLPNNKQAGASIDLRALADLSFATTTLSVFLIEFAVFIPYTYIVSYALRHGFEIRQAQMLNVFLNIGAVPGRALSGYAADRFGTFNTMCVTAAACTLFILGLWLTADGNQAKTTTFVILFGFWSGAAISLTPVCVSRVCKIEDYGKRNGTAFFAASFGALVGVPISGAIVDGSGGNYMGLIIFAGVLYALALLTFTIARGIAGGWKTCLF